MQARHVEVTASSQVETQQRTFLELASPGNAVQQDPLYLVGWNNTGFTSIKLHDGTGTGDPTVVSTAVAGPFSLGYELRFNNGMYAEVVGSGTLSIWLA